MSAGGYLDACGFNPSSGGTGDFVVSAAITGYRTPASAGAVNSTVYSYRAQSSDLSQWENGFGAYATGTTTLARTTVTASSTGSKVSFTSPPNVYITAMSADLQNASLLTSGTLPNARLGASSIAANGYYTLPGGLIIQWGYQSSVGAGTTFPIAFPNNCWSVVTTKQQNPVVGTQTQAFEIVSVSTSGFVVDTSPGNASKTAYYWAAFGN